MEGAVREAGGVPWLRRLALDEASKPLALEVVAGSERSGPEKLLTVNLLNVRFDRLAAVLRSSNERSVSTVVLNFCLERIPVLGCPTVSFSEFRRRCTIYSTQL